MSRRGSAIWYIIGALFFIAAGLTSILGMTSPLAVPIILVIVGAVVIVAGFLRLLPSPPALVVFIIGAIVLAFAASGFFGPFQSNIQTFELTRAQAPNVDEITLLGTVSTGDVRLSFTTNNTIQYRIVFTKYYNFFFQTTANVSYRVHNGELFVNATSTTASVDITVNQNLMSNFNLTTSTGSVRLEAPPTVTRISRTALRTSTGNVRLNVTSTTSLESITATTTTGQVEAYIKSTGQNQNAAVQLNTVTGTVKVSLNITGIESKIIAFTSTGRVNTEVTGFVITTETQTYFNAQTLNYNSSLLRKLDVTAKTTTGSVDITAHHTYLKQRGPLFICHNRGILTSPTSQTLPRLQRLLAVDNGPGIYQTLLPNTGQFPIERFPAALPDYDVFSLKQTQVVGNDTIVETT